MAVEHSILPEAVAHTLVAVGDTVAVGGMAGHRMGLAGMELVDRTVVVGQESRSSLVVRVGRRLGSSPVARRPGGRRSVAVVVGRRVVGQWACRIFAPL